MQHITSLEEAQLGRPSVVTIGAFDGVHRGHQTLVRQLLAHAQRSGLTSVVLTFYPHPEMVLRGSRPGFYLTLPDTKAHLLGEMGIEWVVTHPFDDTVRHMRAADFVSSLLNYLSMKSLWVGADFAMGYQREGNVEFLQGQAKLRGFDLRVVDLMDADGERISSSRVREVLAVGNVEEVARLLGRPHRVEGVVVRGAGRGRTIGIPTANLSIPEELAIPARGVYAGWVEFSGRRESAVINVGLRPTFDGSGALTVEAHLLGYVGDLYDQSMQLSFTHRLRDEQKFDGIEALVTQIRRDIDRAAELLKVGQRQS
jgi:riboflavin kinase/FMN adenylyltransferase